MESLTRYIQRFSTLLKNLVEQYRTNLKKNSPVVVAKGTFDWIRRDHETLELKFPSVAGIYRFSFINRSSFVMDNSLFDISSSLKTKKDGTSSHVQVHNNVRRATTLMFEIELNSIDDTEASFAITYPYNGLHEFLLCYIVEYVSIHSSQRLTITDTTIWIIDDFIEWDNLIYLAIL